jgi:hypothetical protein
MSDNQRDYRKESEGILDGLAESIEAATPEELLEDTRLGDEDPVTVARHVEETLLNAVKKFEQKKLEAARQAYQLNAISRAPKNCCLPDTPHERRRRLLAVFQSRPRLGEVLTIQHRSFEDLSDEDVQSALEELAELGFLDDWAETSHRE